MHLLRREQLVFESAQDVESEKEKNDWLQKMYQGVATDT